MLCYAMLCCAVSVPSTQVEYIAITRDTTESDLKQRREIVGDSVVYFNQAPVRAAINGRLLIIDGIENAERNVLPSLNNLLENREMSLDDGSFLTGKEASGNDSSLSTVLRVHPDFQVVALGLPCPPFPGRPLDPPLRSRFQCRYVDDLSSESILRVLDSSGSLNMKHAEKLIHFYEAFQSLRHHAVSEGVSLSGLPVISVDFFTHSLKLMDSFPKLSEVSVIARSLPVVSPLNYLLPSKFQYTVAEAMASFRRTRAAAAEDHPYTLSSVESDASTSDALAAADSGTGLTATVAFDSASASEPAMAQVSRGPHPLEPVAAAQTRLLSDQFRVLGDMLMDHSCGKHIALLGPKGCGKTILARTFGSVLGYNVHIFPLYNDLSARDLLQRRSTDKDGTSQWVDSPLVAAARAGDICVLDGVERLDLHSLISLKRFLQDGVVDLPDGQRLSVRGADAASEASMLAGGAGGGGELAGKASSAISPAFRVLALGLPPSTTANMDDSRQRWVTSDLGFAHHFLPGANSADIQSILEKTQQSQLSELSAHGGGALPSAQQKDLQGLLSRSLSHLLAASGEEPCYAMCCVFDVCACVLMCVC
jgi:MoxR-like ATPase